MKLVKMIKSSTFTSFETAINSALMELQKNGCEIEDIITDIGDECLCMITYIYNGGEL